MSRVKIAMMRTLSPVGAVALGVSWVATANLRGPGRIAPDVMVGSLDALPLAPTFTVMTLNIAHGRSDGLHQVLTRNSQITANLDRIAALIRREGADIVAFQEADGPSAWSGRFDHVAHLARETEMAQAIRGEHMRGAGLAYGTALMANADLRDALSITFRPNPPTPAKGFVLATVAHPHSPTGGVDVVSVHLDFARAGARRRQIDAILEALEGRPHPRVIMGDLNASFGERHTLPKLIRALSAAQVAPAADAPPTYPSMSGQLDWIVVSPGLRIIESKVLSDDIVSDHRAVVARLTFAADDEEVEPDARIAALPPPKAAKAPKPPKEKRARRSRRKQAPVEPT